MAALVFKDLLAYVGGGNYSTSFNSVELVNDSELLDATTFAAGNVTRVRAKGLQNVTVSYNGFWESATDAELFGLIGKENQDVFSVVPEPSSPAAGGDLAYFLTALASQYNPGGNVGELFAFTINAEAAGQPLIRGFIDWAEGDGDIEAAESGNANFLGTPVAGQSWYAAFHCLSINGSADSTLDVSFETDINGSMFTPVDHGAVGVQILGTDDPVSYMSVFPTSAEPTHPYARMDWAVGGTTPDFTVFGVVGIK